MKLIWISAAETYKLTIIPLILACGCVPLSSVSPYQIVTVQTRQPNAKSEFIGASCELSNKKGKWFLTTPGTVMIPQSDDNLQIVCRKDEHEPGKATVASGMDSPLSGNIMDGDAPGAVAEHANAAGYAYPESIQIVMGKSARIDPSVAPENPTARETAPATVKQKFQPDAGAAAELTSEPSASETTTVTAPKAEAATTTKKAEADLSSFQYKMLRKDECDNHVSHGDYCWWSPPGNHGSCPISASLKKCKAAHGKGCRMGHGRELPKC